MCVISLRTFPMMPIRFTDATTAGDASGYDGTGFAIAGINRVSLSYSSSVIQSLTADTSRGRLFSTLT